MTHSFTPTDIGKVVQTATGTQVGTITQVDGEEPYIEPTDDLTEELRERLGWVDREQRTYPLYGFAVATVTDETVTLRPVFSMGQNGGRPPPGR